MQTEVQNILPLVEKMTLQEGLKLSMREKLAKIPQILKERATRLRTLLVNRDPAFGAVQTELLVQACLDEGLTGRVEFKVPCSGNARAAYVGDALLTLYIAKNSFLQNKSPKDYQADRTRWCQKIALSNFYDRFFGDCTPIPLTWESVLNEVAPTAHQKAEFVEAILGVLTMSGKEKLALLFCSWIVNSVQTVHQGQ